MGAMALQVTLVTLDQRERAQGSALHLLHQLWPQSGTGPREELAWTSCHTLTLARADTKTAPGLGLPGYEP